MRGFEAYETIEIGLVNVTKCEPCGRLIHFNGLPPRICPTCGKHPKGSMICKLTVTSQPGEPIRCIIADGKGWRYTGGLNEDMIDELKGRTVVYYEVTLGPEGLEIGDEITGQTW